MTLLEVCTDVIGCHGFADVETEVMEQRSKLFEERTSLDKQREALVADQKDWDTEVITSKRAIDTAWEDLDERAVAVFDGGNEH